MNKALSLGSAADLSIVTPAGGFVAASGAFLVGEGVVSILYSEDQQRISTFGRIVRIGIGLSLLGVVAAKS